MKLLALDASTEALSVALFDSHAPNATTEIFEIAPRAHARRLLPAAHELMAAAGWNMSTLDGIAFARGPGAFTGLRIAAGLVQGLAAGVDRPVVGVSTLAALAARRFDAEPNVSIVQVVQDARMGEIYTALFQRSELPEPSDTERVIAPADLDVDRTAARAGNGWSLVYQAQPCLDAVSIDIDSPHASDIARLAWPIFEAGGGQPAANALPVYVRDDVARKPR